VRTGRPLRVHDQMTDDEWGVYQRGMRSGIEMLARWVARRLPMPRAATDMLDIGGSHGYWSVALCRRHPRLRSTVLDLPQAILHAAPLLAREAMGDRVVHRAGDALTDDLGSDAYDLVFMAALVHHFNEQTNRELMRRIARALRPGGIVAVWEPLRQDAADNVRQIGGLLDLFLASSAGPGRGVPMRSPTGSGGRGSCPGGRSACGWGPTRRCTWLGSRSEPIGGG
jgi:SAM-dependent methyltransferase